MQTRITVTSLILLAFAQATPALAEDVGTLIEQVRTANARFADASVAKAEGYAPQPCVSGSARGAMGVHFVQADYLSDDRLDIERPEALIYEPQPDGELELVGAEFITFAGPATLEGHLFHHVGAPNRYGLDSFYELHVWAWRENPRGNFADFNPAVSCDWQPATASGASD